MPAHKSLGFSTLRITPRSSICWSSLLTISNSGIETRRGVVIANGWESLRSMISYCTWSFPSRQVVLDGVSCRSPQTYVCQRTLAYLVMTYSDFEGHRCPPPTWRLLATIRHKNVPEGFKTVWFVLNNVVVDSQKVGLPTCL